MTDNIKANIASLKAEHTVVFTTGSEEPLDLLIICQSCTFAVHEDVLAPKSGFVSDAMEVDMKGKQERKITASEHDPFVVQALIHTAYHCTYHDQGSNDAGQDHPATFNAKIYALAEEWQYRYLILHAVQKFQNCILNRDRCKDLAASISVAYMSTPASARNICAVIALAACKRWSDWRREPTFHEALNSIPGFGADVARQLAESGGPQQHETSVNQECPLDD